MTFYNTTTILALLAQDVAFLKNVACGNTDQICIAYNLANTAEKDLNLKYVVHVHLYKVTVKNSFEPSSLLK